MGAYFTDYEYVAAGSNAQVLGPVGAAGDTLICMVIIPATVDAGAVTIQDGSGTARTVFTGGTGSKGDLSPILLVFGIGMKSTGGAWKVTTGSDVACLCTGAFT